MKFILLAATALIATPLVAQTSGSAGAETPMGSGAKLPEQTATPPADATTGSAASTADPAATQQTPTTPPADAAAPPADSTMTPGATPADPSMSQQTPTTPPADPSTMQQPGTTPGGTMGGAMTGGGAGATATGDPVGGYQPSQPATTGTPGPGANVVFQPAPPPSQAYPAPAPLESYPICKRGQYDKCRQRGG